MPRYPQEHKKDPHYKKAKKRGYRARSAFKLLDIQKRFRIFKRAFYILDIGSVPGSWLQVAKEKAEDNLEKYKDNYYHRDSYKIMGADLKKIPPIENIKTIKMDVTEPEFRKEISTYFDDKLDLIICDASIKKSGIKFNDHINQIRLGNKIINNVVKKFLKKEGNFVIKSSVGEDYNNFIKNLKKIFHRVHSYKPKSSRKGSNEIYLICLSKK